MGTEACMVGQKGILEMLRRGEIFKDGSWVAENIRGAAYDLRVADDFLVVPDSGQTSNDGYKKYKKGEKRETLIVLEPGDMAFLSSQEKICMPWTLAGNIGIKFHLARKGVLILTGLIVDPGFGMKKENSSWVPKKDERIHFLVTNLGSEKVKLVPGDTKIASLQFFLVPEPAETEKSAVESGKDMAREFFLDESHQQGLVFVKQISEAIGKIKSLEKKLDKMNTRLDTMEKSTNQIVMFGVYLLFATILGGAMAFVISIMCSEKHMVNLEGFFDNLPQVWPQALLFIVIVSIVVMVLGLCVVILLWVVKLIWHKLLMGSPQNKGQEDIQG